MLNLGPIAPEARIIPLDQRAAINIETTIAHVLWVREKADAKYKFRYNISFFIDSVVVRVLARYAGDHGSNHGQVAFLVTKIADVKYNFCCTD